jgi:hypothetical protein
VACIDGASATAAPTALSVTKVVPNHGADKGSTSVTIYGSGFSDNATASLLRVGQQSIRGRYISVSADGSQLRAMFDLADAELGAWDVVVRNPNDASATLPGGFTIEDVSPAHLSVNIVGADQIRIGQPSSFTILVENRWNRDAFLVPLIVKGIPKDATVSLGFEIARLPTPDGKELLANKASPIVEDQNGKILAFLIPLVRNGAVVSLPIDISPGAGGAFDLQALINEPIAQSEIGEGQEGCVLSAVGLAVDIAAVVVPHECLRATAIAIMKSFTDMTDAHYRIHGPGMYHYGVGGELLPIVTWNLAGLEWAMICSHIRDEYRLVDIASVVLNAMSAWIGCQETQLGNYFLGRLKRVKSVSSVDPNAKTGPQGATVKRFIAEGGSSGVRHFFRKSGQGHGIGTRSDGH